MIVGVDGGSHGDPEADTLAYRVRRAVTTVHGEAAGRTAVLATHVVDGACPRTVVSCSVPPPWGPRPPDDDLLTEDAAGARRVDSLLCAVAGVLGGAGAVVVTAPDLSDGVSVWEDATSLRGAWGAVAAAAARGQGRLVSFPGLERLMGPVTVDGVLADGAIDDVDLLGGGTPDGSTVVDARGFVRPTLEGGRVRLLVRPGAGGVVVPSEREEPHRCCEEH